MRTEILNAARRQGISRFLRLVLASMLFGLFAPIAFSETFVLCDDTERLHLNESIECLRDPGGVFSIEQVSAPAFSGRFQRHEKSILNFGTTRDYLWFKIPLENQSDFHRWVLEVDNPRLGSAECFTPLPSGGWMHREMGVAHPVENREYKYPPPTFTLFIPPGESLVAYLRIRHNGSVRFRIRLWHTQSFSNYLQYWGSFVYALQGALIAMAIYCLCLFVGLREKSYFYYSFLISLFLLFHMTRIGTAHLFLWPNSNWWADHAPSFIGLITLMVAIPFAFHFLNAQSIFPRLKPWFYLLSTACLVLAFFSLTSFKIKYTLNNAVICLTCAAILWLSWQSIRAGYRPARNFLLAWLICVIGMIELILVIPGYLPSNPFTEHFMELCLLCALMIWSFALTGRIRIIEEEQRRILEEKVDERTAELRQALAQVKALRGLLPICSHCKKIRDDQGYWKDVEIYIHQHTEVDFSHGICPDCAQELYPEYVIGAAKKTNPPQEKEKR